MSKKTMAKAANFADTPFFLLKHGNQAIFPTIKLSEPSSHCVCVYGFSDKPIYDKFIKSSEQLVTPYPLVKGYLANQISEIEVTNAGGACLGLVILDATDPKQSVLVATSMATVLLAHQESAKQVPVEIEFALDSETSSYFINGGFKAILPN